MNIPKKQILILFLILSFSISCLSLKTIAETIDKVVAIVNGEVITLTELNEAVNFILKDTEGIINFDGAEKDPAEIKRKVLDRLIDNKLIEQEVKRVRIVVSEREVDNALENMQKENSISKEELVKKLESRGLSLEKYKEQIRQGMEKMMLVNREIKSRIVVNEDELKNYYTDNMDSFRMVTEVRVQHILLPIPPNADEAKIKDVYEKARDLLVKLGNKEDFGKLAKMYSQDTSSDSGGDMGWFKKGEVTPFLEKVVFSLKVGEVSDIITSSLGLHIVKLMDRKEGGVRPFEEVKDEIKDTIYAKRVEKEFKEWFERLRKKSFIKVKL
ncbi:MAG: peptidylprolyl isomerase [Thermodesulfobacteriota bacterium]